MSSESAISVVVPVYNGAGTISDLMAEIERVFKGRTFEVLLVNDGSADDSWKVIEKLTSQYGFVRGINLMRNYGQHNALLAGIRAARHPIIVTIDDDLQNPPEEIPKLLTRLDEGFDVVYGSPNQERHGLWRNLASQLTKLTLKKAMGVEIARRISAFRAFRTSLRDSFETYRGPFVSIDVLLTWGTNRFSYLTVKHEPRKVGQSNYTLRMLVAHSFNMITGFSTLPLQLASFVGFAFTIVGFLVLAYVVGRYFIQGGSVPGFPFLASIIAIFAGAQLFALGIFGEYLGRIHFRLMDKPPYAIRTETGKERR